jgi:hypothetical protein
MAFKRVGEIKTNKFSLAKTSVKQEIGKNPNLSKTSKTRRFYAA